MREIKYIPNKDKFGFKKFIKSKKRNAKEKSRLVGFEKFIKDVKKNAQKKGREFIRPTYIKYKRIITLTQSPSYNEWISFLIQHFESFSPIKVSIPENGILLVPVRFSLSENFEDSMFFLKRLFSVLYNRLVEEVIIDYINCKILDVDASAVMDIILAGFIEHYEKCNLKGHSIKIKEIKPINITPRGDIYNVLHSIGAFANLKGFYIENKDIVPFKFRIGDKKNDSGGKLKEIHETEIVDYVIKCLAKLKKSLNPTSETDLSKVVGEVMANAEEHSNFRYRYAIGYFVKTSDSNKHFGVFQLVIFNFGQTIYDSFKNEDCQNTDVVKQMQNLSEEYTNKGWFGYFGSKKFEEQTLWTLYALQEKVTSKKDWRRGNGSIRFIDRFFKLKGNEEKDNTSKLTLISGNTKILFDGSYPLIDKIKGKDKFKIMSFNKEGDINIAPDKEFVTFTDCYFPGTLISVKLVITEDNLEIN
jgi:hypothetical protein